MPICCCSAIINDNNSHNNNYYNNNNVSMEDRQLVSFISPFFYCYPFVCSFFVLLFFLEGGVEFLG